MSEHRDRIPHSRLVVITLSWGASAFYVFFFNDTATTEIYTLSLHDALPIFLLAPVGGGLGVLRVEGRSSEIGGTMELRARSEEHTSELQSPCNLVCRLLLEKKNQSRLPRHSALLEDVLADATVWNDAPVYST